MSHLDGRTATVIRWSRLCIGSLAMAAALLLAGANAARADFTFVDFSDVSTLTLNGNAAQVGSVLRVAPAETGTSGSAWYTSAKAHVAAGFDTTFTYQMWNSPDFPDGADGLAFVIQNQSDTALGNGGSGIGFEGILSSLAVKFDTFGFNPEPDNYISVQTNGLAANTSDFGFSLGYVEPTTDLNDGNVHFVRIKYVPGTITVYLDDLVNPILSVDVDLTNIDGDNILDTDGNAWVGFTAGTGLLKQDHDIRTWNFNEGVSTVVASNMAPDPMNTGHSWDITGADTDGGYVGFASTFTASGNYSLFQMDVAVSWNAGTPSVMVALYSDSGGLPGTLVRGPYTVAIPSDPILTSVPLDTPFVVGTGQSFWVAVLPGAADTDANWNQNPNLQQFQAITSDGINWSDSGLGNTAYPGQFDVLGVPGTGAGNCDCQSAMVINENTFTDETLTGVPPCHGPDCGATSGFTPGKIYAITPSQSGSELVNTYNNVNFDTFITVHSGCPLTAENQITCSEDSGNFGAQVQFCAQGGHTYYVRIAGVSGATGNFGLLALLLSADIADGPFQNPANGHWYYSTSNGPWSAFEQLAISKGGHLASISNAAENEWVRSNFATITGETAIGINDATTEGTFAWSSGEPVTYTNWQGGAPNNNATNNYGVMGNDGTWTDQDNCSGGAGGGVIEVNTVPLPGIIAGPIRNPANCHDYYFTESATWIEAQLKAQTLGGNLVTINNAAENEFVRTTFANYGGNQQQVWIGFTDQAVEGTFVWIDGSPVTYTNWDTGEPNNLGNEDYALMSDATSGKWNDGHSGGPISGVIEIAAAHCPCQCPLGDMNCDDAVTIADIQFFVQALLQPGPFGGCNINNADMNGDTKINGKDIQLFINKLLHP